MEVLAGSKGWEDGVARALRFCVMESSRAERERRRKSGEIIELVRVGRLAMKEGTANLVALVH